MPGSELVPATLRDKMEWSQALAPSTLLPAAYRGKPESVLYAVEFGAALGVSPLIAITQVHIIEGKPTASAQLISALVRKAGHRLRIEVGDGEVTATIVRRDDPEFTYRSTWTLARAQAAQLIRKGGNWEKYPEAMLTARSITEVARAACAEALNGMLYTAEELGAEVDADGAVIPEVVSAPPARQAARRGDPRRAQAITEPPRQEAPQAAAEPVVDGAPDADTLDMLAMIADTVNVDILRGWYRTWTEQTVRDAIMARVEFVQRMQQGEPVDAEEVSA